MSGIFFNGYVTIKVTFFTKKLSQKKFRDEVREEKFLFFTKKRFLPKNTNERKDSKTRKNDKN